MGRQIKLYAFRGEMLSQRQIAERLGVPVDVVHSRIKRGALERDIVYVPIVKDRYPVPQTFPADAIIALNALLRAVELGKDVRVMWRDKDLQRARSLVAKAALRAERVKQERKGKAA